MQIKTKFFGEMEIDETGIITFNEGLPGFAELTRFALINDPGGAFYWLQSVQDSDTAFILIDMNVYDPEYSPIIDAAYLDGMGDYSSAADFAVLNIATLQGSVDDMTVNLRAPLIINTALKLGRQIVCGNDDYPVRYHLFKDDEHNE